MADIGEIKGKVTIEYDGSGIKQAKEDLASLAQAAGSAGESAGQASEKMSGLDGQMSSNAGSAKEFSAALEELPKIAEGGISTISEMTGALSEHQAVIAETGSAYESLQKPVETTMSMLQEAAPPMQAIAKQAESMQTQVSMAGESFAQVGESLSQSIPMLPQFAESMHTVSESFDPSAFGLDDFVKNSEVFQEALSSPTPFSMMKEHLLETGQTWDDFTSSLSGSDSAMFSEMVQRTSGSYQVLDKAAESAQKVGTSFTEAANSAGAFTAQYDGLNESVTGANKSLGETGAILEETGKASKGGMFSGFLDSEVSLGGIGGGILNALNDVAMPLMAVQMIGAAVGAVGQSIYDAAAVAEGPGAHGIGTFTGAIDTLGTNVNKTWQSFSEGIGQGLLPTLDAVNNVTAQNGGNGGGFVEGVGKLIGTNLGALGDLGQIVGGGLIGGLAKIVTLNPGSTFGNDWMQAGSQGLANTWANLTGAPEPYPGPPIPQQNPMQGQIDQLNAVANNPEYLAAQAGYQSAYGKAVKAQESWDVSHYGGSSGPMDPMNDFMQMQAVTAAGGTYGDLTDPNAIFFGWNDYINGKNGPIAPGCFPAGSCVLMANRTTKLIEDIQIGDSLLAHNGKEQVETTVVTLIRLRPKLVYELAFSGGTYLRTTDSHPISTIDGWKSLSPETTALENPDLEISILQVGDIVHTLAGSAMLLSVKPLEVMKIYNLTVDEPHTFYVEKILVHNKASGSMSGGLNYSGGGGGGGGGIDWGGIGNNIGGFFGGIGKSIGDFWNAPNGGADTLGMLFSPKAWGFGGDQSPQTFSGGCFIAGTPVLLADGTSKPIETLRVDERVLAYDGKKQVPATIIGCISFPAKQTYELTFDDGNVLVTTDSHPIAGKHGWKSISPASTAQENPGLPVTTLQVGDSIYTADGTLYRLMSIQKREIEKVYNITVDTVHTYYAARILVHNAKASGIGPQIGQQASEQIGDIQLPHMDLSGLSSQLGGNFSGIQLPHMDMSGISGGLAGAFSGISLPHIDMSGISGSLAGAFSGISMPPIPNIGSQISGALGGMFSGITMPSVPDIGGSISGALGGMFSGITMPSIPNIGGSISGALSGMFGSISIPSPPQVGGMINGAMSGLFGGIQPPSPPEVGAMINGVMGGIFSGIQIPAPPNLGAQISSAMSGMFSGISMPSVPFFADGVSNFSGGAAVVGEGGAPEVVESNGQYALFDQGAAFVNLPAGSSVYPMQEMASYSSPRMLANGTGGGGISPLSIGGGGMPQSISVNVHLDSQMILSAIEMPMAQNIRVASGNRSY